MTDQTQAEGATVAVTSAAQAPTIIHALTSEDLAAARDLVIKANPNAIPEMVAGTTLAELTASAERATAAYERIVSNIGSVAAGSASSTASPADQAAIPPVVPAGGAAQVTITDLPPAELIKRGLSARAAQNR